MKANNTGWKQEMDKLYKQTLKNWKDTGETKKSNGLSCVFSLNGGNK